MAADAPAADPASRAALNAAVARVLVSLIRSSFWYHCPRGKNQLYEIPFLNLSQLPDGPQSSRRFSKGWEPCYFVDVLALLVPNTASVSQANPCEPRVPNPMEKAT